MPVGSVATHLHSEASARPTVAIASCESADKDSWDRFLATQAAGSFYHLFDWKAVNTQGLGHRCIFLAARSGGEIVGTLPLVLVESRLFGRILCSMPFVNYGGACATTPEIEVALARAAIKTADELKVDYLELRSTKELDIGLAASLRKVSMTVQLAPNPDTIWESYTSKHRKNVKRAYKDGLTVSKGGLDLVADFYSVMEESWRNLGTPLYRREYFERVLGTFPDNTSVFLCRHQDKVVAAALTGYFNGVVEGLWAGGRPEARKLDANYVLYWEMIRDSCMRGCHSFHLGRSTADSGGEEFKRKWNAEARQLYWYYHRPGGGEMPSLNVDNPKYRLAIDTWRKLPLSLTRVLGPPLARSIP